MLVFTSCALFYFDRKVTTMINIITARQAAGLIHDGMTVGISGFGSFASPDRVLEAIRSRFKEENSPKTLPSSQALRRGTLPRTAAASPRSRTRE